MDGAAGFPAIGFAAAFVVSVVVAAILIPKLRQLGVRQTVSEDAPARHAEKQGTPTMGGIAILAGILAPVAVEAGLHSEHQTAFALLGLTVSFGLIGFLDDYLIATRGKNLGLKARHKLILQFVFASAFVLWMRANMIPLRTTFVRLGSSGPLSETWKDIDLGTAYYLLGILLIVGMSNAINFLDGLDGLAAGVCSIVAVGLVAVMNANHGFGWLTLFAGAVAGACAGFLWFNCHPAQVFMGDTGSLALGAALPGMAMLGKAEAPFQVFAIIPWITLFSVMIQVTVFKYRARRYGLEFARANRVFRRTPIHHHFEEIGWNENQIVLRWWIVTAMTVAVTVALLRM